MSAGQLSALRLELADTWIQGWLTAPPSPRGAILLVPPFFHEWQRGYRLFALLADALAARDVATMRFDYRGCGDSGGDDHEFIPRRATEDALRALDELERRIAKPVAILAVRAGALVADRIEQSPNVRLWTWQPVVDGADYFGQLRRRHLAECNNTKRFPFLVGHREADAGDLMGHRVHAEFGAEMTRLRLTARTTLRIDAADAAATPHVALPPELSRWVDEVDISSTFPAPMIRALADRLAQEFDPS